MDIRNFPFRKTLEIFFQGVFFLFLDLDLDHALCSFSICYFHKWVWSQIFISNYLTTQKMCDSAASIIPRLFKFVPDSLETHQTCDQAVFINPLLEFVLDHFKTKETFNEAVIINLCLLEFFLGSLRTQAMSDWAVSINPCLSKFVPDHVKDQV